MPVPDDKPKPPKPELGVVDEGAIVDEPKDPKDEAAGAVVAG